MSGVVDYLGELIPFLAPPLFTADRVERVGGLMTRLPAESAAFYLECRLSPPGPEIDVLASLTRADAKRMPRAVEANVGCEGFLDAWASGTTAAAVPFVWLELDDAQPVLGAACSNLHVCLDQGYVSAGLSQRRNGGLPPFDFGVAKSLLDELARYEMLSAEQLTFCERSLGNLPSGARLIHLSVMSGRKPAQMKLYVTLPGNNALDYANATLARSLDLQMLEPWLDPELNGNSVYLDLTLRAGVGNSVGLVFSQPQVAEVGDPSRALVRARLIREGLATLAQDAALSTWLGASPKSWTEPGKETRAAEAGDSAPIRLKRWLDIKVTLNSTRLSSKAYLGFAKHRNRFLGVS